MKNTDDNVPEGIRLKDNVKHAAKEASYLSISMNSYFVELLNPTESQFFLNLAEFSFTLE